MLLIQIQSRPFNITVPVPSFLIYPQPKTSCRKRCSRLHSMPRSKGVVFHPLAPCRDSLSFQMKCVGAEDGQKQCQRCKRANVELVPTNISHFVTHTADVDASSRSIAEGVNPAPSKYPSYISSAAYTHVVPGCQRHLRCFVASKRASIPQSSSLNLPSLPWRPHTPLQTHVVEVLRVQNIAVCSSMALLGFISPLMSFPL